ncbi:MAG TPA: hypothetical protein VLI55_05925 [Bryobacteraceae bacterium]|nr:hypothetical protein [Bryobacteraceae bacterium]
MIRLFTLFLVSAPAWLCLAQQTPSPLNRQQAQAEAGLENPWDVRSIIAAINKDAEKLRPLLAGMKPQQWYDLKGAPSTYILQLQTAQRQVTDVDVTTKMLSQKTEDLSLALDEYFRLEALDISARSLAEGARKYGPRGQADQLDALVASNFTNRQRFREYLKDLATSTEQNFKIADEEAQRCRGIISKEPPPTSKRLRKY